MRDTKKDREICEKATPGPWEADIFDPNIYIREKGQVAFPIAFVGRIHHEKEAEANALFIATAREALPYYIDELEKAHEERNEAWSYLKKQGALLDKAQQRIKELEEENARLKINKKAALDVVDTMFDRATGTEIPISRKRIINVLSTIRRLIVGDADG